MPEQPSRGVEISVVIPVHDAASTLGGQLKALCAQSFDKTWEIVVVDDASTDETAEVARSWAEKLPLTVVSSPSRRGAGPARNLGTRSARGRFVAYCDADDVVSEHWLSGLAGVLEKVALASGPRDLSMLNPPELYAWRTKPVTSLSTWKKFLPEVSASNMGVRREAFDMVGGFDETVKRGEDCDFAWRVQLAGGRVGFAPDALVHYRLRTGWPYFRRHYQRGVEHVAQYLRFREHGMPRHLLQGAVLVLKAALSTPLVLLPGYRYRWLTTAGTVFGHVVGSIRYRALYL